MTNTVTMIEKVTKIIMKSRYSPISGITWEGKMRWLLNHMRKSSLWCFQIFVVIFLKINHIKM